MDTESWLIELEIPQYIDVFAKNDLDWSTLPTLDDSDLKEIGIQSLGHRKKLMRAINALQPESTQPDPPSSNLGLIDSERRQVSVMFCDLVGSTELSTRLDAEDVDALIRAYQETVTPLVHEFRGHVARFAGDGILSYFGYPHAIEFEAESAVRAAIKIVSVVGRSTYQPGIVSQVRIGIATGDVVIGGLFDQGNLYEAMATGETPNLAARLQGLAQPGGIIVCDNTQKLAGRLLQFEDAGLQKLKGFDRKKRSWKVAEKQEINDRSWMGRVQKSYGVLEGRQGEVSKLLSGWRRAQASRGSSVLITGETGVGKTRLFSSLLDAITEDERSLMRIYCEQYYRSTPLYPFISFFNNTLGTSPEDPEQHRQQQLESYLQNYCAQPETVLPFIARMLDIPGYENDPLLVGMSPQRVREATMEAGVSLLQYSAQNLPIIIAVEDLHWADPTTLAFLEKLAETVPSQPIYLVMTARPEVILVWSTATPQVLTLDKLSDEKIEAIIGETAGEVDLPGNIVKQICDRSDGIPLYAEEITKSIVLQLDEIEAESMKPTEFTVPNALQSGLLARLDKLSGIKEFALLCSVIGREFTSEFASLISNLTVAETELQLQGLVDSEILEIQPGLLPHRYVFRHTLLRDAAYGHLLRARRRELHAKLASALEEHFPNTVSTEPELLARHYTSAGCFPQAIQYWLSAGQRALAASASIEAAEHLTNGLELLEHLPKEESVACGLELQLQMSLAPALIAVKGFAAPEVKTSLVRSRKLCDMLGASEAIFPAMRGLMSFNTVQADYKTAIEIGQELQSVVDGKNETGQQLELAWVMGSAFLFSGEHSMAMSLFEQSIELYDAEEHAAHTLIYGQDPGVASLTHYQVSLNCQGRYDEAQDVGRKALKLSNALNHPFTKAQAVGFLQSSCLLRGDIEGLSKLSNENLIFCQEQGFPVFMALSMIYNGWCRTVGGDSSGIEETQMGIDIYSMSGAKTGVTGFLITLAESYLIVGNPQEALNTLEQCSECAQQTGEFIFSAAILEGKARVLCALDFSQNWSQAHALLVSSVESARASGTGHYELVALTTLARMQKEAGEDDSSTILDLHAAYHKYGQGLESKPMLAARALLN